MSSAIYELELKPPTGWQSVDFREIWLHRELLGFLIWRDVKIRYRQTALGGLWAIIQPLFATLIFFVFFNKIGGIQSNGPPYVLFAFAGTLMWTFASNAITMASNSLIGNEHLISKIYFPRIFIPLGAIGVFLLDLVFGLVLMGCLMVRYHWFPTARLLCLPVFVLGTFLAAGGLGIILAAINVKYRDVKYAVPFFVQMGLFVSAVIYPISYVPARFRPWMGLNPFAGMAEGFRYSLLHTDASWAVMGVSLGVSLVLFICGLFVFRRMERYFADLI